VLPIYSTEIAMNDEDLSKLESLEVRPVRNGFLVTTRTEDEESEFVFDSHQKTLRFIKKAITPVE
jgi:hypothetical protein